MTSTPKRSTEAEDVLDFLNSLPDTGKKDVKKTDADILEFLDELEATDKGKKDTKKESHLAAPVKEREDEAETGAKTETTEEDKGPLPTTTEEEQEQDFVDPIASISNWWSSSGSATVNSLWSNAQQLTQKAQEEATKLAKDANIDERLKKLQGLQLDEETRKRIISAGDDIDPSKALGFFTKNFNTVLSSIMSTDEVLKISVTHDLENYNVDSQISKSFKKVMKQVQGGIDIEIVKNTGKVHDHDKRNLNIFQGKAIDGEKLALANLETSIKSADTSEVDSDISSSNLFISILAIQPIHKDTETETIVIDSTSSESFHFLVILKDTTNDISILTRSQAFPIKWSHWLDGSSVDVNEEDEGVDPAEWVKNWIYDGIGLSMGILAQSYVVKRMGYA